MEEKELFCQYVEDKGYTEVIKPEEYELYKDTIDFNIYVLRYYIIKALRIDKLVDFLSKIL